MDLLKKLTCRSVWDIRVEHFHYEITETSTFVGKSKQYFGYRKIRRL